MVSSTGTPLSRVMSAFTDEQLASLERTYGRARHPVWVRDFADRCVYRNPPASREAPTPEISLIFEIVDHNGTVVGTLATVVN